MRADEERKYTAYVTAQLATLRRVAHSLCRDPHRAADLVQTTITKLYVHWRLASEARDMDAYVRTILMRCFLNEQRLRWAKVRLFPAAHDIPTVHWTSLPDVETQQVVRTALTRLPAQQRAVVVLRFLCDLPTSEVARVLGCTTGNVTSLSTHGLRRLRTLLDDQVAAPRKAGRILPTHRDGHLAGRYGRRHRAAAEDPATEKEWAITAHSGL